VELLAVLVLLAILGFAAYPLLSNVREVLLVKGAAEHTAAAVRMARTVVAGYDWQNLSDSGTVSTTGPTLVFDPIGNRVLPVGPTSTTFSVDTVPPACATVITVTLYGGVRVAGC
jgi:hypothetical protein